MNIKLLPEIINIYDNIIEEYDDYKIIIKNTNNYEINYDNLTKLFQKFVVRGYFNVFVTFFKIISHAVRFETKFCSKSVNLS